MVFSKPIVASSYFGFFFFFNDTATTEIYTLSLHDALPISRTDRLDVYLEHVFLHRDHETQQVAHPRDREVRDQQIGRRERRDLPGREVRPHDLRGGAPALLLLHQIDERAVAQEMGRALLGLRA